MLAAAAGVAAGGGALWHYNRSNFLWDRKLRQEQEFAIFEWRKVQAELWREDVRDIIELTEKKMDNYLIISTLQFGMCAALFSCGRLEPGTPPWLLHFYMLTLGGAFMCLLMSVWFAMHAGVAAQCASVRMLTQFVRLPVPDWQDFEGARTYAHAYESVSAEDMLRVPFTSSLARGDNPAGAAMPRCATGPGYEEGIEGPEAAAGGAGSGSGVAPTEAPRHADPWRLEKHGDERGFYELQRVAVDLRRHIALARRAALQFQCFDAFARVSMSIGTHQLLYALAHFALGYLAVQDAALWAAWCIVALMMCMSAMMMHVDFSLTRVEQLLSTMLVFAALLSSSIATLAWTERGDKAERMLNVLLPVAYGSHGLWLLNVLHACGLQEQGDMGAVLPMKFRAVLYLDVFGWLSRSPAAGSAQALPAPCPLTSASTGDLQEPHPELSPQMTPEATGRDTRNCGLLAEDSPRFGWSAPAVCKRRRGPLMERLLGKRAEPPSAGTPVKREVRPALVLKGYSPLSHSEDAATDSCSHGAGPGSGRSGTQAPQAESGTWGALGEGQRGTGPAGEVRCPPEHAFEATTYCPKGMRDEDIAKPQQGPEDVTGQERLRPTQMPAKLFKGAIVLLACLWAAGFVGYTAPVGFFKELTKPLMADVFVESIDPKTFLVDGEREVHAVMGTDSNGLPELIPIMDTPRPPLPRLEHGRRLHVEWPSHSAFLPRALTCDPSGTYIIVADDFGLYAGRVEDESDPHVLAGRAEAGKLGLRFRGSPHCNALDGRSFEDISAVCDEASDCGVMVLHGKGSAITECPFLEAEGPPQLESDTDVRQASWEIETDWIRTKERVKALAIRSACFSGSQAGAPGTAQAKMPLLVDRVGCVVVGTTAGRIVELTSSAARAPGLLAPQQVLHESVAASSPGSLADVPGGFILALWYATGTISAFDREGKSVGEWKLPGHVRWLMLCAGGGHVFVLGVREAPAAREGAPSGARSGQPQRSPVELRRFPLPGELRQ